MRKMTKHTWHIVRSHRAPVTLDAASGPNQCLEIVREFNEVRLERIAPSEFMTGQLSDGYSNGLISSFASLHWMCWSPFVRRRRINNIYRSVVNYVKHRESTPDASIAIVGRLYFLHIPSPVRCMTTSYARQTGE